ncbi:MULTISPECIES: hypothetical protein [unclassified Pseudomonas]|uniref:hypothetical protein n=1 Tax=unclassified Pseudomonas TaxID=196821 RepID=UPI000C87F00D|nr:MULTISPECIES: hypothetical protein [unclassified Pseudomonas]PNA01238.1 hypothetical protein C1X28_25660 [Pseudomonas sp. FW305-BF15]PNB78258.1 hypothetical protein C1X30_24600 [Pseudomonas sp. FW305-BF6]
MPIFTKEESLLVWIHEKRAIEERHLPVFGSLLFAGWVTATQDGDGQYSDIALTPRGQAKVDEAIFRD